MSRYVSPGQWKNLFDIQDDGIIVQLLRERNDWAYQRLIEHVFRTVRGCLHGSQHADAEDITQSVVIAIFHGIHRFRGEAPVQAWLDRIVWNKVGTYYRQKSRDEGRRTLFGEVGDKSGEIADLAVDPAEEPARVLERQWLLQMVERLPKEQRTIVLMICEGYEQKEIARVRGIPEGTVNSRLRAARERLRQWGGGAGVAGIGSVARSPLAMGHHVWAALAIRWVLSRLNAQVQDDRAGSEELAELSSDAEPPAALYEWVRELIRKDGSR